MKTAGKKKSGLGTPPEARLFEQAQGGCQDSLALLMDKHEPLVIYAVNRQNLGDLPIEEADQAGRIGLWQAIQKYDPAVKTHCVANRKAYALGEMQLFLPHWEAGPAAVQAQSELRACLHEMVECLPERLRKVMDAYYDLAGQRPLVLREIGLQMGVTRQRVQQLKAEALVRLRHPAHSQELRTLLVRHSQQEYEWVEEMAQIWLRRRAGRHG